MPTPEPAVDPSVRWSDAVLDAARTRGDALADATVASVFATGQTAAVSALLGSLMRNDQPAPAGLPDAVQDYLAQTSSLAAHRPETVARGQRVFAEHGPEILMLLCCYSLPSSYAARKGVQVLHQTAYLAKRPNRRLFETAQMIVDVLSPGGLDAGGRGVRSAQKVRLMHAAIRHLILADARRAWPVHELGMPINQEDLLGTLMTFTWLIIDGLLKQKVAISAADQAAYLETWLSVGELMGIEPALLPRTVADAEALTVIIERRQVAPSSEGSEMMAALLGMMNDNIPEGFRTLPSSMIREFLPADVATFLGVPNHFFEREALALLERLTHPLEAFTDQEARRYGVVRAFSVHLLRAMTAVELDGKGARFALPDALTEAWQLAPADSEESFWKKLAERRPSAS
jgi:hypothetical protein